jgi:hypothetical protein
MIVAEYCKTCLKKIDSLTARVLLVNIVNICMKEEDACILYDIDYDFESTKALRLLENQGFVISTEICTNKVLAFPTVINHVVYSESPLDECYQICLDYEKHFECIQDENEEEEI